MSAPETAAVLFDFGGTLDSDGLPWKERVYRLLVAEGIPVTGARFDPLFYRADDALVGALSTTCSLRETVTRLVAGVAEALELRDPSIAPRIARRFLDDALARLAGNVPLLERLARRYRLGVVSNFYGNLSRVCDDAGIRSFFDVLVDSAVVGCTKPDPRIFRQALDALGIGPAAAIFVGDSLRRDMAGARGVGMRHIWLEGRTTSGEKPCCPDDRRIGELSELEGILL